MDDSMLSYVGEIDKSLMLKHSLSLSLSVSVCLSLSHSLSPSLYSNYSSSLSSLISPHRRKERIHNLDSSGAKRSFVVVVVVEGASSR